MFMQPGYVPMRRRRFANQRAAIEGGMRLVQDVMHPENMHLQGPITAAIGAASGRITDFFNPSNTRSGKSFRGDASQSNKPGREQITEAPRVKRKFRGDPIPPNKKAKLTMSDGGHKGGHDEVPVVNPPKRISKIVPDYFTINFPYAEANILTTALATPNLHHEMYYRLNSINDPNGSTGGHNPMGTTNWSALLQYLQMLI